MTGVCENHMFRFTILFIVLFSSFIRAAAGQQSTLIDFVIEDQFNRIHHQSDDTGKIRVVIGSDKNGSPFNEVWGLAIHDSLKHEPAYSEIKFLPLADLRGVPFFLKGYVKGRFSDEMDKWVLMDWDGLFSEAYGFESDAANILIFNGDGQLIHKTHGQEILEEKMNKIIAVLRALLQDHVETDADVSRLN